MNSSKRQFVHEYCEHFGCESVAYDAEPKRNVVATAQRDKVNHYILASVSVFLQGNERSKTTLVLLQAWLPSVSLLELIQREQGQRKVPGPAVLSSARQKSTK